MEDELIKRGEEAVKRIKGFEVKKVKINVVDERGYIIQSITGEEYAHLKYQVKVLTEHNERLCKDKEELQKIVDTLVEKQLKEWEDLGIDIYRYVDI